MVNNITEAILAEKTDFICNHSTFFHYNQTNINILTSLRNILLNPAPLTQCEEYEELMLEIKQQKRRIERENIYQYSLETLFNIVYLIRSSPRLVMTVSKQTEIIRQYVKYVNTKDGDRIYYHNQNMISFDIDHVNKVKKQMKENNMQKRRL